MTLQQYQELARKTLLDLGSMTKNMSHMHMGEFSEAGEFISQVKAHLAYGKPIDLVNLYEELGDFFWFYTGIRTIIGTTLTEDLLSKIEEMARTKEHLTRDSELSEITSNFCEHYTEYSSTNAIVFMITMIRKFMKNPEEFSFVDVLEMNIAKLEARYKKKEIPSPFDSLNRDLIKEREVLEQKIRNIQLKD